jgi:NitT/TauT family transport system substrate-binding protein
MVQSRSDRRNRLSKAFTFYLDWIAGAQFAGLHWAKEKGLYESVGLDVTLESWKDDGRSVFDKVRDGSPQGILCAGCAEDNLIIKRIAADQWPRVFGAMLCETPLVLMFDPEQEIRCLADLRGKRIGMHEDGIRALTTVLALEEIPVHEIDLQVVDFDLAHLHEGRLDVLQGYLMTEPVQLASLGFPVDLLQVKHPQLHPSAQVYFADEAQLRSSAKVFSAFLSASSAGWREVCTNPNEASRLLADVVGDTSDQTEQLTMLERVIPLVIGDGTAALGAIDEQQWARNLATYLRFGHIDRPLALLDVVVSLDHEVA